MLNFAQEKANFENTARGAKIKVGNDIVLCKAIQENIKDKKSPYAVVQGFNNNGWPTKTRICEKTLYNYINIGLIDGICRVRFTQ